MSTVYTGQGQYTGNGSFDERPIKDTLQANGWKPVRLDVTRISWQLPYMVVVVANLDVSDTPYNLNEITGFFSRYLQNFNIISHVETGQSQYQPSQSNNTNSGTYTVKSGDTLSKIAKQFNTTWQALAQLNGLTGNAVNQLRVGQVLRVSGSAVLATGSVVPNIQPNIVTPSTVQPVIDDIKNTPVVKPDELSGFEKFALGLGVGVPVLIIGGVVLFTAIMKPK